MSFPPGVTTCEVSFGPADSVVVGTQGQGRFVNLVIRCDRKIIHAATGTPLYPDGIDVTPNPGEQMLVDLPHVDQPGFIDEAGNAVTGWFYTITGFVKFGSAAQTRLWPPTGRDFQVVSPQDHVDLDKLPRGLSVPAVSAPVLYEPAGTAQQLVDDLEAGLSASYAQLPDEDVPAGYVPTVQPDGSLVYAAQQGVGGDSFDDAQAQSDFAGALTW